MTDQIRHDLKLPGCTPEPLMAYLKAFGILRLVSEQKDRDARGWWRNNMFYLRSTLDRAGLVRFFVEEYKPTPIMVPWSGSDFFGVNWQPQTPSHTKTPTASRVIEAILATTTPRFEPYRRALLECKRALDKCAIDTKETMGKQKWFFIQSFRSICRDPRLIEWIDAASVGALERFAPLLGSGGGSDGNTHFSDNFMQNLWDVLPDFDVQRKRKKNQQESDVAKTSVALLGSVLFEDGQAQLTHKRTSSLFDSGAVGGPNATQGMERGSLSNPWNVILALEGVFAFAGAPSKRLGANLTAEAVFPFQVSAIPTGNDHLAEKEGRGSEVWLPTWDRPALAEEVESVLREGRAQCGSRLARSGVDMARSAATLGVDRGIDAFNRYAIIKGRVGGENYNTAASLGRFVVRERREVDLIRQIDVWLDRYRSACSADAPARFTRALRSIDAAIFDFCRYDGNLFFQKILIALGRTERELALTPGKLGQSKWPPGPLAGLSHAWIDPADDGSPEFAIALAIASVHDMEQKIGPLRTNLEPVDWQKRCRAWAEKDRAVVWNAADLPTNLANVLQRRMMDGDRAGCERLPLAARYTVPLEHIAAFIAGELDDERIEELIWGLMLLDPRRASSQATIRAPSAIEAPSLPRDYALLKLLFLPRPLVAERSGDKVNKVKWRLARFRPDPTNAKRERLESGITIRPERRILPLLRAGRVGEACRMAAQRLRISGLPPMPGPLPTGMMRDAAWAELAIDHGSAQRLAAALLIPVTSESINRLVHLVCRDHSVAADTIALAAEGVIE